jgi:thiol-disulfide isomerase/thioredoxin
MKIVKISAVWCPSCLVMRPRFIEIEKKYPNIEFTSLDIDLDEDATLYNPGPILPVLILLNDDCEVARIVGEHKIVEISKMIDSYMEV